MISHFFVVRGVRGYDNLFPHCERYIYGIIQWFYINIILVSKTSQKKEKEPLELTTQRMEKYMVQVLNGRKREEIDIFCLYKYDKKRFVTGITYIVV